MSHFYQLNKDINCSPKSKVHVWSRLTKQGRTPVGLIYIEERQSYENLTFSEKTKPLVDNDIRLDALKFEKIIEMFR